MSCLWVNLLAITIRILMVNIQYGKGKRVPHFYCHWQPRINLWIPQLDRSWKKRGESLVLCASRGFKRSGLVSTLGLGRASTRSYPHCQPQRVQKLPCWIISSSYPDHSWWQSMGIFREFTTKHYWEVTTGVGLGMVIWSSINQPDIINNTFCNYIMKLLYL